MLQKIIPRCWFYRSIVVPNIAQQERYLSSSLFLQYNRKDDFRNDANVSDSVKSTANLPEKDVKSVLDPIVFEHAEIIKSFAKTEEVLHFMKNNAVLDYRDYAFIFDSILKLQKSGCTDISNIELTKKPEFEKFCSGIHKNIRFLQVCDAVNIFKVLQYLKVSANCKLCQSLLQMISKNVNALSVFELIFLDYLLKNCSTSPLSEALKIAIPIVFETNFRVQINREDSEAVYSCLLYAFSENKISTESREFLINVALNLKNNFSTYQALWICNALCNVRETSSNQITLYSYLMDNVAENMESQLKFYQVNVVLKAVIKAFIDLDQSFYHDKFIEKSINFVINQRLPIIDAGSLLRSLNRVSYPCYKLIDYIDEKFADGSVFETVQSPLIFISFLDGCSNCVYKPKYWNLYEKKLISFFDKHKSATVPMVRIATNFIVMKCWVTSLIDYCFQEIYLQNLKNRGNNASLLDTLLLYQIVTTIYPGGYKHSLPSRNFIEDIVTIRKNEKYFPLEGALAQAVGGYKFVLSGVCTRLSHFIDHLIVKRKNGQMVIINEEELQGNSGKLVESLEIPEDSFLMGIMLLPPSAYCLDGMKLRGKYKLLIHSLEALGIGIIPISKFGWINLLDPEKIPYLSNKIETRTFVQYIDDKEIVCIGSIQGTVVNFKPSMKN